MLITLDAGLQQPLYVQIRDQIRERIVAGDLKIGDRLDPSRELAKRLGVHRTTVGNAYAELEAEGLIQGTVGRGTFVSPFVSTLATPKACSPRVTHDFSSAAPPRHAPRCTAGRSQARPIGTQQNRLAAPARRHSAITHRCA